MSILTQMFQRHRSVFDISKMAQTTGLLSKVH